ncbi:IclR family transcriptional regulator [Prauserella marina]|uniref:IclR helix-turn-helix domain-containing protein n=1 Tax=Prauserella marina TaxID=530584 RepID=A0A222VIH5_9PSEU|nr:helix-turn-helix domain-containing protein [Prauserella marina]ASR33736.1 IclR family transcriptional regulator [Prauserella marina]PWV82302.1 IclR-like helix-turn-helix domain-containing protein [Prauserella marina]SDC65740.1 IclR helix-turn-helix domain-containing protein [Prauserella marina]
MSRESSLTLDRGLALLQAVADTGGDAITISELAVAIGGSRAAVYRLLVPLVERGLVWRDGSKVRLGAGVLRLAEQMLPQLREAARPVLRELAEALGVTVHLSVAEGEHMHVIAVAEPSWTAMHVAYRVGSKHPLSRGAAGKAVGLRPKGRQWAAATGEPRPGISGVAAPLRGVSGLRASVGVVSFEPLDNAAVGPELVAAAVTLAELVRR